MHNRVRYVVISPVRNEASHLQLTVDSMLSQTITPSAWVIVDDGSVDGTKEIAGAAASSHPWIRVMSLADRGFRQAGGGVVQAFYEGYRVVASDAWDFVVKLDGDLSFESNYFERCFESFDRSPTLGIAGGVVCIRQGESIAAECKDDPKFHVRGATKIYRRGCWEAIGGLVVSPGWDTLDEVKANMLGWGTTTLHGVSIVHHRPTGEAYGAWRDRVKNGVGCHIAGYHPLFMLLKCLSRMGRRPVVVGGLGLLYGYAKGSITGVPRFPDPAVIRYFRQQQLNRLLFRKSLWS